MTARPAAPFEKLTSLSQRIAELSEQHGSLRAAARFLEIDAGYLSRLSSGEKSDPGDALLQRMGLQAVTTYQRIEGDSADAPTAEPAITDAMVEAAAMALLGKKADPNPGVNWWASRQWRVNAVREKMRKALEAAAKVSAPLILRATISDAEVEALKATMSQHINAAIEELREPLLTATEQRAITEDPNALAALISFYDCELAGDYGEEAEEVQARTKRMEARQRHFLALGRTIILRDPFIWEEGLKAQFAPRRSEGKA